VISIVIGHQQRLTQDGLAITPRDAGEQVGLGICHQRLHFI